MNDLFGQLAKLVPVNILAAVAILWVILKALPDSAQFFGDFLPSQRRLRRTREALETLKAKIDVYALSKEHDFQTYVSMQDAVTPELAVILSSTNGPQRQRKHVNVSARIMYAIFLGLISELIFYGVSVSQKGHVQVSDIPSFTLSYCCVLLGAYSAHRVDMNDYSSRAYYYFAGLFGFMGGLYGLWLGNFAMIGAYNLVGWKT